MYGKIMMTTCASCLKPVRLGIDERVVQWARNLPAELRQPVAAGVDDDAQFKADLAYVLEIITTIPTAHWSAFITRTSIEPNDPSAAAYRRQLDPRIGLQDGNIIVFCHLVCYQDYVKKGQSFSRDPITWKVSCTQQMLLEAAMRVFQEQVRGQALGGGNQAIANKLCWAVDFIGQTAIYERLLANLPVPAQPEGAVAAAEVWTANTTPNQKVARKLLEDRLQRVRNSVRQVMFPHVVVPIQTAAAADEIGAAVADERQPLLGRARQDTARRTRETTFRATDPQTVRPELEQRWDTNGVAAAQREYLMLNHGWETYGLWRRRDTLGEIHWNWGRIILAIIVFILVLLLLVFMWLLPTFDSGSSDHFTTPAPCPELQFYNLTGYCAAPPDPFIPGNCTNLDLDPYYNMVQRALNASVHGGYEPTLADLDAANAGCVATQDWGSTVLEVLRNCYQRGTALGNLLWNGVPSAIRLRDILPFLRR